MVRRFIVFACVQALLQNVYTKAILPNCGCQQQVSVTETCVQNPVLVETPCQPAVVQNSIVAQPGIVAQTSCQPVLQSVIAPYELEYVGSYAVPPVIIQDDTMANNLANTLQLLIVSNLLGNTLPFNNLGVTALAQPNFLAQPGLFSPALSLASPALQVAPLGLPALVGCGCGCGCNGLSYIL